MSIEITYKYLEIDGKNWKTRKFTAEEYFDPTAPRVKDEGYRANSLPEHYNPLLYIGLKESQVLKCIVFINDRKRDEEAVFSFTYWNDGKNRLLERTMNFGHDRWQLLLNTEMNVVEEGATTALRVCRNEDGVLRIIDDTIYAKNGADYLYSYGEKDKDIPVF